MFLVWWSWLYEGEQMEEIKVLKLYYCLWLEWETWWTIWQTTHCWGGASKGWLIITLAGTMRTAGHSAMDPLSLPFPSRSEFNLHYHFLDTINWDPGRSHSRLRGRLFGGCGEGPCSALTTWHKRSRRRWAHSCYQAKTLLIFLGSNGNSSGDSKKTNSRKTSS